MTAAAAWRDVWERPDGSLVIRDVGRAYGADVEWLGENDSPPEGAVRLAASPGDDLLAAEARELASEMHRWAPDGDALRVRDRLLTLARALRVPLEGAHATGHAAVDGERPLREQTAGELGLTEGTRSDGDAARYCPDELGPDSARAASKGQQPYSSPGGSS